MSFKSIHPNFKLNGIHLDHDTLFLEAYSFIKEGNTYQQEAGLFLLDWLDDNSFIQISTSGTTGKPKIMQLDKQAMVNSALMTGLFFNLQPSDKILHCLPTKFIAGKMMFVRAMVLGLELDFVEPTSNPLLNNTKKYHFAAMVPLQVEKSIAQLNQIDTLIIGGAKLSPLIAEIISKTSCKAFETYGMTETITHIAVKKVSENYFTTLPNITIKQDKRNCLVINAPKLNVANLVTNDIIEILSENQFVWLGRHDNVINSGGVKLYPEQIEQKLASKITNRFFIAGISDSTLGQKVVLFIEGNAYQLNENIFKNLDKYEKPKEIKFILNFEETETEKIKRQATINTIL
jgi:o-succinylbenzoate---CoA ligase